MRPARLPIIVTVFAKPPRPGQVKTRLAAGLGAELAAAFAAAFLEDTSRSLARAPVEVVVATTALDGTPYPGAAGLRHWLQGDGNLGARLASVLDRALSEADYAVAVGADAPSLPPDYLEAALATLTARPPLGQRPRAVLGHALDGGFYLLGVPRAARARLPELFAGIPWSHTETGQTLARRLVAAGFEVALAPPWYDIDETADLTRLFRHLARPASEPATERGLGQVACTPATAALASTLDRSSQPFDGLTSGPRKAAVSAIVPTLDEASRIGPLVERLLSEEGVAEVLVIDGGSADDTVARARAAGALAALAPRGRAVQLNAGARLASEDHLLFVHADVRPPRGAGRAVLDALADPAVALAAFTTFTSLEGTPSWLGPLVHLADVRSRLTRHPYGDQAMAMRRADFEAVGGFLPIPVMEDYELSRRLLKRGRLARLSPPVMVSGRRLAASPLVTTLLWNVLPTLYRLGVDPERLSRWYRAVR